MTSYLLLISSFPSIVFIGFRLSPVRRILLAPKFVYLSFISLAFPILVLIWALSLYLITTICNADVVSYITWFKFAFIDWDCKFMKLISYEPATVVVRIMIFILKYIEIELSVFISSDFCFSFGCALHLYKYFWMEELNQFVYCFIFHGFGLRISFPLLVVHMHLTCASLESLWVPFQDSKCRVCIGKESSVHPCQVMEFVCRCCNYLECIHLYYLEHINYPILPLNLWFL